MFKKILVSFVFLGVVLQFNTFAQKYVIDASHSAVLMKVQRFGVVNVVGRFGEVSGIMEFHADEPEKSQMNITVTVDSYTANNPGGEESARGPAFLDGASHPTLNFALTRLDKTEQGWKAMGNLTIKGVTKQVQLDAELIGPKMDLPTQKQSIALSGVIKINRLDYGVGPDRKLPDGTDIIGNEVTIMLEVLGIAQ